jgi:hypothetical protein
MKNLFIIPVVVLLLTSCTETGLSPEQREKINQELRDRQAELAQSQIDDARLDSLAQIENAKKELSLRDSIQIVKAYTSDPNSAGGVDLHIIWKNKAKRTIKYLTFYVKAINAVGDEVFTEIGYSGKATLTGPVKPGVTYGYGGYWDCFWYNSDIRKCKVTRVELEFMDGTEITIKY